MATFFDLSNNITKDNCQLKSNINNTATEPAVLYGGSEIIITSWLNKKSIEWTFHSDIPVRLPDYTYFLIYRYVLCNCELEVEHNFLLDHLVVCPECFTNFKMYLTVNSAFVYYFEFWTDEDISILDLSDIEEE